MSSCKALLLRCCRAASGILTYIDFAIYDSGTVLEKQAMGDSPVHEIIYTRFCRS